MSTTTPPEGRAPTTIGPVRSRRTFEELRQRGAKGRFGPLTVSFLEQPSWSGIEIAYAVNRRVGSAVVRNRLKRRLRAIVAGQAASLPAGSYVVRIGRGGALLGFDELRVAMNQALERASADRARPSSAVGPPGRVAVR